MSDQRIDRTKLPIRRPPFQGVANQTLDGSQPDWNSIAPTPAPEGAPERPGRADRRCGLRQPEHVRRADRHADARPAGGGRGCVQPLPHDGAVLADAGGADDRPQPSRGRDGRHGRRVRRAAFPGYSAMLPRDCRAVPEGPAGERLFDGCVRQVAPDARQRAGPGRPVRPLAERLGLRLLLGLPRRRVRPVRPR